MDFIPVLTMFIFLASFLPRFCLQRTPHPHYKPSSCPMAEMSLASLPSLISFCVDSADTEENVKAKNVNVREEIKSCKVSFFCEAHIVLVFLKQVFDINASFPCALFWLISPSHGVIIWWLVSVPPVTWGQASLPNLIPKRILFIPCTGWKGTLV